MRPEWRDFKGNKWMTEVNVRDFIQNNYTPYVGEQTWLIADTGNEMVPVISQADHSTHIPVSSTKFYTKHWRRRKTM